MNSLIFAIVIAAADPVFMDGTVVRVSDGDTISVVVATNTIVVHLAGIDAPETRQPFGRESRARLVELVDVRRVRIQSAGVDRYGRTLGIVFVIDEADNAGGDTTDRVSVNERLVSDGLAWHYKQFAPRNSMLAAVEIDARESHRGLWSGGDSNLPVSPWEFRKARK